MVESDPIYTKVISAGIYLLRANNRNTRTRCEICSKVTYRHQSKPIGVVLMSLLLTFNISNLVLVFLFLTLNM